MIDLAIDFIESIIILAIYGMVCYYAGKKAQREDDTKLEERE